MTSCTYACTTLCLSSLAWHREAHVPTIPDRHWPGKVNLLTEFSGETLLEELLL